METSQKKNPVFVTGATGYLGRPLIAQLLEQGFQVFALARKQSIHKLPAGVQVVVGDALNGASYAALVPQHATFVHLIGVPHPSPSKAAEFERVDLASVTAALEAARTAQARHFIYVSVAQPAPVMHAYQSVRVRAEAQIRASGIPATFVRPWYVLGPGHRWPVILLPIYFIAERIPALRESTRRLRFVTLRQMVQTLTSAVRSAVRNPPADVRVIDVAEILGAAKGQ